jgi:hypothetical protein
MVNPTATYLLFDLNNHKYTEKCLDYLRNAFPSSNINVIFGDSTITIPKYISLHSDEINTYEMCHLDGGHTEDIFSKDYENTKILLNENGIVIFDDFDMEPIYNYINRKIHDKEIYIEDDQNIIKNSKHCIYRYTNEQNIIKNSKHCLSRQLFIFRDNYLSFATIICLFVIIISLSL